MALQPAKNVFTVYEGPTYSAEWYFDSQGAMPAFEFFRELSKTDQDRLLHLIKHMCDKPRGTVLPKTLYNMEDAAAKIYAFKPRDSRFFNFLTSGSRIIITNAYTKQAQKLTKKSRQRLAEAVWCRTDYLRRVAEGSYYERA